MSICTFDAQPCGSQAKSAKYEVIGKLREKALEVCQRSRSDGCGTHQWQAAAPQARRATSLLDRFKPVAEDDVLRVLALDRADVHQAIDAARIAESALLTDRRRARQFIDYRTAGGRQHRQCRTAVVGQRAQMRV